MTSAQRVGSQTTAGYDESGEIALEAAAADHQSRENAAAAVLMGVLGLCVLVGAIRHRDYTRALVGHWRAIVITGFAPAALGIGQLVFHTQLVLPWWGWLNLAFAGLLVAGYRTWDVEHRGQLAAIGERDSYKDVAERVPEWQHTPLLDVSPRQRRFLAHLDLLVTNLGPHGLFQATDEIVGDPESRFPMRWERADNGDETAHLLTGAHGTLPFASRRLDGQEHTRRVRILCEGKSPVSYDFTIRWTRLGVYEIKNAAEPWPRKEPMWFGLMEVALSEVNGLIAALGAFAPDDEDDADAAEALTSATNQSLSKKGIIGSAFQGAYFDAIRSLNRPQGEKAAARVRFVAYKTCAVEWQGWLELSLREEQTVPE